MICILNWKQQAFLSLLVIDKQLLTYIEPENTLTRPSFVQSYHSAQGILVKSMSSPAKTLVDRAKREEFMAALRLAKEDKDGAKAYARLNPVSIVFKFLKCNVLLWTYIFLSNVGMLQV